VLNYYLKEQKLLWYHSMQAEAHDRDNWKLKRSK